MNDKDLNGAIETAQNHVYRTGSKTELGREAREHLSSLLREQARRALAKPSSPESPTE